MWSFWRCPEDGWDYDRNPRNLPLLRARCEGILRDMRKPDFRLLDEARDTRKIHRRMFKGTTPICFPYYAGNYRGDSRYRCLKDCPIFIGQFEGEPPQLVQQHMDVLSQSIDKHQAAIKANTGLPPKDRVLFVVSAVCAALVAHQSIHPYANGNGHAGRFLVWALLLHFGYIPRSWPLEERPPDPPFSSCITAYRFGNPQPLETFVLGCL